MQEVTKNFIGQKLALLLLCFVLGVLLACLSLSIVSFVEPNRLVPISVKDILNAVPLVTVLYAAGCILTARFPIRQAVEWYSTFFIIRLLIAIVLSLLFMYDDERGFHYAGIVQPHGLISFGAGRAYYHLVAILHAVFGSNILLPKIVNAFIGSLLPFVAFNVADELFKSRKAAWRAFLFSGFLPPFLFFSSVALKEILTAMLLLMVVRYLVCSQERVLEGSLRALIVIALLYWVRGAPLALVGLAGLAVYHAWNMIRGKKDVSRLVTAGILLLVTGVWLVPGLLSTIQEVVWSRVTKEAYFIERFRMSQATVMGFLNVEKPFTPRNLGILFLRGLYSPSPLRWVLDPGIDTLVEGFSMLVWYILFPLAVIGILRFRHRAEVMTIGAMGVAVLAMATMGIMVGTDPFRHKIMGMGLFAVLASAALDRKASQCHRWVIWIWILGAIGFTLLWLVLRL